MECEVGIIELKWYKNVCSFKTFKYQTQEIWKYQSTLKQLNWQFKIVHFAIDLDSGNQGIPSAQITIDGVIPTLAILLKSILLKNQLKMMASNSFFLRKFLNYDDFFPLSFLSFPHPSWPSQVVFDPNEFSNWNEMKAKARELRLRVDK